MNRLTRIYKENIFGVIGTLVFHILFFMTLLVIDLDVKNEMKEQEIIIEFPENLPLEKIVPEEENPDEKTNEAEDNVLDKKLTNVASNRLEGSKASSDEAFQNEIENAQKLSQSVNNNLSKKRIDLGDIQMPVETTEGLKPEEIKNVIYSGESNIVYYLDKRYHLSMPVPVYLAQGGGKAIVDIVVNQQGRVISAKSRKNASIRDEMVYLYAEYAASNTVFNTDYEAPKQQKGTIHYTFSSQ